MIEFRQTRDDVFPPLNCPASIVVRDDRIGLDDIVEGFERFLCACGYVLPEGAHIGYEYDEVADCCVNAPEDREIVNSVEQNVGTCADVPTERNPPQLPVGVLAAEEVCDG